VTAAATRVPYLCPEAAAVAAAAAAASPDAAAAAASGVAGMLSCDDACGATVAFVSKMFAVPHGALPAEAAAAAADAGGANPDDAAAPGAPRERFLAFCRVFAGTLRAGDTLHVLPPGAPPSSPATASATVTAVYLMMGRGLQPLACAPAGAVVALAGLDTSVLKCATLASCAAAPPLRGMYLQAAPTVRVALEPTRAGDLPALLRGLSLLNRADPSVEVEVADSGEVVLGVAGEVHLQRCLTDLRERFARVPLAASPPLVAFRESAAAEAWPAALGALLPREGDKEKEKEKEKEKDKDRWAGVKEWRTPNGWCALRARVAPLPALGARVLDECADTLRACLVRDAASDATPASASATASASSSDAPSPEAARAAISERLADAEAAASEGLLGEPVAGAAAAIEAALRRAWALGPRRCGANVLLTGERRGGSFAAGDAGAGDAGAGVTHPLPLGTPAAAVARGFAPAAHAGADAAAAAAMSAREAALWADVAAGVGAGFQAACERGPLCDEPLWGCAFEVCAELTAEGVAACAAAGEEDAPQQAAAASGVGGASAPFTGQVLDAARKALRGALEAAQPRLAEQHYLCVVTTAPEALGGCAQACAYGGGPSEETAAVLLCSPLADSLTHSCLLCVHPPPSARAPALPHRSTYAVLHRRRARVLREIMSEGTGAFSVAALLPVAASFALADELRQHTSGAAGAQLLLSHWERVATDPRFVPTTAEELEEFGADAAGAGPNAARALVDAVRRRKGLPVEEKVVAVATKQRTQARKR
jgi:ribosome assembly protein 1